MAASIKIPSIFTAENRFSDVVFKMTKDLRSFAAMGSSAISRVDQKINGVFRQMSGFAQVALGLSVGVLFSSMISDLKDYETAVASFRTIVSDLNDEDFSAYRNAISTVASDTKRSTVEVALSFERIAGLNEKFAETADQISAVSAAAITLSKASGDELGSSAENLVGIMNQFSYEANQADKAINILAAGQAVGAASITQTAESFVSFGSVAKGANITLEESVGLIQTLGKFSIFGSEAGNKLKSSITKLQQAGVGYANGQFSVNDALVEAKAKMDALSTAKDRDTFVTKTFGLENLAAGRILLANIDTYKEFTKGVTGTTEAQKAAAINSNTLAVRIDELKNSFTNYLTTNSQANKGLEMAKNLFGFLANNIDAVVMVVLTLVGAFVTLKTIVWGTQAALFAYNVVTGFAAVVTTGMTRTIATNTVALAAYRVAMGIGTAVTWLATAATTAFGIALNLGLWPIVLIIAAIAAVVLVIMNWSSITDWFAEKWKQFTTIIGVAWEMVVKWFTEFDFKAMFIDIGQSIMKFMLTPLKMMLTLLSNIPGKIGNLAQLGLDKIAKVSGEVNVKNEALPSTTQSSNENISRSISERNSNVNLNIVDKGNNVGSVDNKDNIPIKIGSTLGAY